MEFEELLAYLNIDAPEDFEYFEHLADLIELEQAIDYDAFYQLLSQVSAEKMQELLRNYFSDITENMPDTTVEIHTLMAEIRRCLAGLARQMDTEDGRRAFIDELFRFRNWYAMDGEVVVKHMDSGKRSRVSVSEALALYRLEALNGDAYDYDFDDCLDYQLDEYSMSINEAMSSLYEDDAPLDGAVGHSHDDDCDCDDHDHHHQQDLIDGLVDLEQPVMDDDFSYLDEDK